MSWPCSPRLRVCSTRTLLAMANLHLRSLIWAKMSIKSKAWYRSGRTISTADLIKRSRSCRTSKRQSLLRLSLKDVRLSAWLRRLLDWHIAVSQWSFFNVDFIDSPFVKVQMYGSMATGLAIDSSDMDLLVSNVFNSADSMMGGS